MERIDGTYRDSSFIEELFYYAYCWPAMWRVVTGRFFACKDLPDGAVEFMNHVGKAIDTETEKPEVISLFQQAADEFNLRRRLYVQSMQQRSQGT